MGRGDGRRARAAVPISSNRPPVPRAELGNFKRQLEYRAGDPGYVWHLMAAGIYRNSNMGVLATREALQNSIDAIRRAQRITALLAEGKTPEEIVAEVWPYATEETKAAHLETVLFVRDHPVTWGRFEVVVDPTTGTLSWRDNGVGMSDAELQDNFLSIGGSDKRDDGGAVGGFGVAKAVELGCGPAWEIRTRDNHVLSTDLLVREVEPFAGTEITVSGVPTAKAQYDWQNASIVLNHRHVLEYSDVGPDIDLFLTEVCADGSTRTTQLFPQFNLSKDTRRPLNINLPPTTTFDVHHLPKGVGPDERVVVRLNGLAQFDAWLSQVPGTVVIDVTTSARPGDDDYPFVPSRQGLRGEAEEAFEAVKEAFRVNPLTMTRPLDTWMERYYQGEEILVRDVAAEIRAQRHQILAAAQTVARMKQGVGAREDAPTNYTYSPAPKYSGTTPEEEHPAKQSFIELLASMASGYSDVETKAAVNDNPLRNAWKVKRNRNFTQKFDETKHLGLLMAWAGTLEVVASAGRSLGMSDLPESFRPGFLLDADVTNPLNRKDGTAALCEQKVQVERPDGSYEVADYILINPWAVYKSTPESVALQLWSLACHELCHFKSGSHNETFTSAESILQQYSSVFLQLVRETKAHTQIKGAELFHPVEQQRRDRRICPLDNEDLKELREAVGKRYWAGDDIHNSELTAINDAIDTVEEARRGYRATTKAVREAGKRVLKAAEAMGWRVSKKDGVIEKQEPLTYPKREQMDEWVSAATEGYYRSKLTREERDEAASIATGLYYNWGSSRVPFLELPARYARLQDLLEKARTPDKEELGELQSYITSDPSTPWSTLVEQALRARGGRAKLSEIYSLLDSHPKTEGATTWRETIRCLLQRNKKFRNCDNGEWQLQ